MSISSASAKPSREGLPQTAQELQSLLDASFDSAECLSLGYKAEQLAQPKLHRSCLEKAIALDRNNRSALLALAALSLDDDMPAGTYAVLEEAARITPLPDEINHLRIQLSEAAGTNTQVIDYKRITGLIDIEKTSAPLSIILITNLFPPQELGGYGRMMWEFAHGLLKRGHKLRVLTGNAIEFAKNPTPDEEALEQHVQRSLQLTGTWKGGRATALTNMTDVAQHERDNTAKVRTAITKLKADLILVGNLDYLGMSSLRSAFDRKVPVLHAVANKAPGFSPAMLPPEPTYWMAPCSDWNCTALKDAGFAPSRMETLYPGARVDRFFRLFLPDTSNLRICYASLVLPYKGAHTLIEALAALHKNGVNFTAEIAGDTPDLAFLDQLMKTVREVGMESKVTFTGFLNRQGLFSLFGRNNVLVFPSIFEEPFGISQVEALAAGLVVVSSGTGGAKEIIHDGVDGLLFPAGDAAALASRLKLLAENKALMTQLQKQGQANANLFSVDRAVQKIEALAAEMKTIGNEADLDSPMPQ